MLGEVVEQDLGELGEVVEQDLGGGQEGLEVREDRGGGVREDGFQSRISLRMCALRSLNFR